MLYKILDVITISSYLQMGKLKSFLSYKLEDHKMFLNNLVYWKINRRNKKMFQGTLLSTHQ